MPWIGLDIGGANLKVADAQGSALSAPFPLWRDPNGLADAIAGLLDRFGVAQDAGVAITMTGELADCYASKAEGVHAIVDATRHAAKERTVRVATVDDRWLTAEGAKESPHLVAAANWRLGARLAGRLRPGGRGLWIDVGSTTTDIIPVAEGEVASRGVNDTQRLINGELIYTGVRRTPVCTLVGSLPYRGNECPVAAEWFATTADIWTLLAQLPEEETDTDSADGRPMTRRFSIQRLARCVGADGETFHEADAMAAAERVAATQVETIATAINRHSVGWVLASGEGAFLADRAAEVCPTSVERLNASELVGAAASRAFPAYAAAVLASRGLGRPS